VWPRAAIDSALETGAEDEDTGDDPERWLPVQGEGSREAYRDMELFIASVEDPGRAERLRVAIKGRGPFRRFKDELGRSPGEVERWHALCEERQRDRARSWPRPATACCRPSTTIPENGPCLRHRPELSHGPARAAGFQSHAR